MIAIYGGSFDPPHHAHVMVALWAMQRYEDPRVLIIPAYKHALGKEYTASFEHRLAMCREAFSVLPQDRIEISTLEAERGGTSYMIETIQALKEKNPNETYRLLVGSDLVEEIPKWHRGQEIIQEAKPVIVPRLSSNSGISDGVLPMVSSTTIRELISSENRNKAFDSKDESFEDQVMQLIPVKVWNYIKSHELYL